MKLVLTSAGITNTSIADALTSLISKHVNDCKVGFIPTAANMEAGNKDWYIAQLTNLQKHGFNWIDIIELADESVDWKERLESVDIVFVSGGNTFHLLDRFRKSGFDEWLREELDDRVYVGVSAGSIVAAPTIAVADIPPKDRNFAKLTDLTGVGLVDFEVEPHCDEQRFTIISDYAQKCGNSVYAIDDQTAISVNGDKVQLISEGTWKLYE